MFRILGQHYPGPFTIQTGKVSDICPIAKAPCTNPRMVSDPSFCTVLRECCYEKGKGSEFIMFYKFYNFYNVYNLLLSLRGTQGDPRRGAPSLS